MREAVVRTQIHPSDPPSLSFVDSPGHKIEQYTRGTDVRTFGWLGAERIDEGGAEAGGEAVATVYREGEVLGRQQNGAHIDFVVRLPEAILGRLRRREGVTVTDAA